MANWILLDGSIWKLTLPPVSCRTATEEAVTFGSWVRQICQFTRRLQSSKQGFKRHHEEFSSSSNRCRISGGRGLRGGDPGGGPLAWAWNPASRESSRTYSRND